MGPGAQHRNRQHPPTKPQDSLVVLVGVELAVPAGEGVATLAKQHKGLVLVHVAIHRALTVPRLGWSWGMGSMKRELILTTSSSRSGQRSGLHFLPVLQPWAICRKDPEGLQQWTGRSRDPCSQNPLPSA